MLFIRDLLGPLQVAATQQEHAAESPLISELCDDSPESAALLAVALRFRRLFRISAPDAPGLAFVGAQADPEDFDCATGPHPVLSLSGAGQCMRSAFAACVGEGIEYLSQFVSNSAAFVMAEPTDEAVGPPAIRAFVLSALEAASADTQAPVATVAARRLRDGASARFPVDLCFRRPLSHRNFVPPYKLSTGCAAAPSRERATLRALLELIERDAAAIWWRGGRRPRAVAYDSTTGRATSRLLRSLRRHEPGRTTRLLDITSDLSIPVIAAISTKPNGYGFAFGLAARPTQVGAAQAAVIEMCQMELAQAVVTERLEEAGEAALTAEDRAHLRRAQEIDSARCVLLQPESAQIDSCDWNRDTDGATLDAVAAQLATCGFDTYVIDLTHPALGLPTARVIAPGLQIEPSPIVTARLADTIAETGGGATMTNGVDLL